MLHRELDAASERIYRLKHNDRYRTGAKRKYGRYDGRGKHHWYQYGSSHGRHDWRGRQSHQVELAQRLVVSRDLAFALQDVNLHLRLIVRDRREDLRLASRAVLGQDAPVTS